MLTQEEALQALLAGEQLEFRRKSGDWIELINKNLILDNTLEFRVTPKVTIANGIEIPLGYQGKMTDKQTYFLPNLLSGSYYDPSVWVGSHYDNMMMRRGLVFLSREDAIDYADAMVRLGGGDASAF